jgi:hypothetical protein
MTTAEFDPILGEVRLCRGCGETWPLDSEFYWFDRNGKPLGRCKACWSERVRDEQGRAHFVTPLLDVADR